MNIQASQNQKSFALNMKRIVIVGTCGSGKTTLGKILSNQFSIPCTDLDNLYWLPNWTPRPHEEFAKKVEETAKQPSWIICGNQSKIRPLFLPKADTVIWLDLPFLLLLRRILKRGFKQFKSKEEICNGNQQSLRQFIWLLSLLFSSYRRRKKTYQNLKKHSSDLHWIHLKTEKEVNLFINQLKEE